MVYTVQHIIGNKPHRDIDESNHSIFNPALGEVVGQVQFANKNTCDLAVATAKQAWHSWAQSTAVKRAKILFKFRELLEKYQNDLARLVTQEHGKTIDDAKGSIARAIEVVELHCGIVSQLQGHFSADVSRDIDCYTLRQPLGVCAGVSPFNFPVMVPIWMIIPAISCGNTFVIKPSEQDPSAPARIIELLAEAGLPDGVVNCVHGDKTTVDHLLFHPDVRAVTAVASTAVAEYIYQTAITNGKRAHTFGGAKNHCVVMPDANLEQAAQAIVGAGYGSAGERCMAISVVVIVGHETAERFIEQLVPLVKAIRIEPGEMNGSDMGPLVSQAHRQRVLTAIDRGVEEGAKLLIDGRTFKHPKNPDGFFLAPSLFDHVEESMFIYQQEIFGPVLCLMRVNTLEEALTLINRNQYGNGSAIFTRDGYSAREYCQQVHVGMVGINIPIPVPIASHPFGGWKRSSFGDTNMHGTESINFYTRRKTITAKWPVTHIDNAFNMPTHD